ncbi:unnamed protein product [Heligmosomoides polygyrus]|uniref:Methyltranfer_dom domain-containing protein n=1 Tax=Heligmosomoides polygyrus TaxID=6339 RepID=A0A183FBC6_HELPZ|nr:unnamed protein product [Heligmosomoides polygyrus]
MCSLEKLQREAGFSRVTIYEWPHPLWAWHGQKAQGFCQRDILEVQHQDFTCNDGKWVPENFVCPGHLRTHYQ